MTILKAERGTRSGQWGLGGERQLLGSWGWHRLRKTVRDGRAGVDVERAFWVEGAVWAEPKVAGGPAAWRAEQTKSPKGADGRRWLRCWEGEVGLQAAWGAEEGIPLWSQDPSSLRRRDQSPHLCSSLSCLSIHRD